ncbi:MAG TPA: response regulator transcription factor [Spirochaetia bacterium]|nr:response regulator transcription factor [Spirochaetia bacterium]
MDEIRVLIVDDQELLRGGIRTLLDLEGGFTVVGMARNGKEAVAIYAVERPDVVLMDIRMPEVDGITATARIVAGDANARILMLTTFADDSLLFDALRAGARGYLLKDASAAELAAAVREVHAGNGALGPGIAMMLIDRVRESNGSPAAAPNVTYSRRELEVLRLLAEGFSNREIADRLFLAEGTVKNRVSDILVKIDARDRTQAALRARELGLL